MNFFARPNRTEYLWQSSIKMEVEVRRAECRILGGGCVLDKESIVRIDQSSSVF